MRLVFSDDEATLYITLSVGRSVGTWVGRWVGNLAVYLVEFLACLELHLPCIRVNSFSFLPDVCAGVIHSFIRKFNHSQIHSFTNSFI